MKGLQKYVGVTVLSLLVAGVAAPAFAAALGQVTLRWKLAKGQSLRYSIEETTKLGGADRGLTEKLTLDTTWTVTDDVEGGWQVGVRIDRVRFTASGDMGLGGAFEVKHDTKEGTAEGKGQRALADLFSAMAGAELTFQMDRRGRITDLRLPQKLAEHFGAVAARELAGFFFDPVSDLGLVRRLTLVVLNFPEAGVDLGGRWNHEAELHLPSTAMLSQAFTYTYRGINDGDGKLTGQRVSVEVDERITTKPPKRAKLEIPGKITGDALFDGTGGRLLEARLRLRQEDFRDSTLIITLDERDRRP